MFYCMYVFTVDLGGERHLSTNSVSVLNPDYASDLHHAKVRVGLEFE